MKNKYVAGIDIGGTNTAVGIVDANGTIIARTSFPTWCSREIDEYVDVLSDTLRRLVSENIADEGIAGIGIGAPNVNARGEIAFCENLPWTPGVPLGELVGQRFEGVPVAIANDANAAAIGEMTFGATKGLKNFIMITLGTGVGSGIVADGRLLVGHKGFAGELGHTVMRPDGRPCGCGRKGCLEAYCSATGVARTAREMLAAEPERPSLLRQKEADALNSKDVYDAAIAGDELAAEVFRLTGDMLGEALAGFVTFSDPEAFVLFGGLTASGPLLMEPLRESFARNLMEMWNPAEIKILFSALRGADAALLGAAALALGKS